MRGQIDVVTPEYKLQMARAVNFQQFAQLTFKINWLINYPSRWDCCFSYL